MSVTDENRAVWRRLGVRDAPTAHDYDALVEGVPAWLERSLWRWAMDPGVRISSLHHEAKRRRHRPPSLEIPPARAAAGN